MAVRAERVEPDVECVRALARRDRHAAARQLHERGHALARARRVRDHDAADVDDAGGERAGHVVVDLLAVDDAVLIVGADERLADDERHARQGELAVDELRAADERVAADGQRHPRTVARVGVRAGRERQRRDRERAHRLGEAAGG